MSLSLSDIVKQKINAEGPISFRDFMEMALYYPGLGYYTSPGEKIGKQGDYITSPYFSNVYGSIIAKQLEEMWHVLGEKDFTIVEYGAGPGHLCIDILNQLRSNKKLYKNLSYIIIEKSEAMRNEERKNLCAAGLDKDITWCGSIEEIPPFTGCIIANEVLDNFSVHRVVMKENELKEVFVEYDNEFIEVLRPAHENLQDYFKHLKIELPDGFFAEVNLQATEWIKNISGSLRKGFVLTIDYGFLSAELYQSYRRSGTIVCYYKHTVNDLPYNNIGQQDITAHVNFSALDLWGKRNGLMNCGFTTQSQFLSALGLTEQLRKLELKEKNNFEFRKKLPFLHTLVISMGKKFKVLIQQKGLEKPRLSGLQFCQPLV